MERDTYGLLDANAPVVSLNDLYELESQLSALWNETMDKAREEQDMVKWGHLHSELRGIEDARHVVSQFVGGMIRRMPME